MAFNNYDQFIWYKEMKDRLAGMLTESSEVIKDLNMTSFGSNLRKLGEKVNSETFKIQVVGTFKNGKSTFINALLGEYTLPAYALPCTAVINEVKYGVEKKAKLHFNNPLPKILPASIPVKAINHMKAYGMKDIPPLEINPDEIEDYVVIPMGCDPKEMLLETPYEKVELFWPLEILKNGVEIIDSPGLNEHATRTKVTMEYLTKADAILFVLNAQALCSQDEMNFIENNLQEQGFTEPFFVVNRFDCIPDKEKEAVKRFAKIKLDEFTTNGIFFISAQDGLDAKEKGDTALYTASGVKAFEARLSEFLTRQKGKAKLAQPSKELKRMLNDEALYKVIPSQRAMLRTSLDEVKKHYEEAKPQLETLKAKKEQLMNKMLLRIEQSKYEFRRAAIHHFEGLTDMVPAWIDSYDPTTKFKVVPTKSKVQTIISEIADYVSSRMEEQQKKWQKEVLQPLILEKSSNIFDFVEADLTKLFNDIDKVNVQIAGREDYTPSSVPVWQRIAGVAGGLVIGDIGLAAAGGINGFSKEMALTAAFEFGAGFLLAILGCLNPFTLGAVLISAIIFNFGRGQSNAMKKVKQQISDEIVQQLSVTADKNASKLVASIAAKLESVANQVSEAIDTEIKEAENQVKGIISEMEKGKTHIEAREKIISSCEAKIRRINSDLDLLIMELVETN